MAATDTPDNKQLYTNTNPTMYDEQLPTTDTNLTPKVEIEFDEDPSQHLCNPGEAPDSFTCGSCGGLYSTICSLHEHIQSHSFGGSYHYDHRSRTAFPKFDSQCSATQTDAVVAITINKLITGSCKQPTAAPQQAIKKVDKYVSILKSQQTFAQIQKKVKLQKAGVDKDASNADDSIGTSKKETKFVSILKSNHTDAFNQNKEGATLQKASVDRDLSIADDSVATSKQNSPKVKLEENIQSSNSQSGQAEQQDLSTENDLVENGQSRKTFKIIRKRKASSVKKNSKSRKKARKILKADCAKVKVKVSKEKLKTVKPRDFKSDHVLRYSCVQCRLVFHTEEYFASHMKKHDGSLICDCCSDEFSSLDYLKGHLFDDERVKALQIFVCSICNLAITEVHGLKAHYCFSADDLRQERLTVLKYPSKSGKKDQDISSYVPLVKTETDIDNAKQGVQCQQCLSWFENEYFLTLHSVVHRFSHKCSKCIFHFLSDIDLGLHQLECKTDKSVECRVCGKRCPNHSKMMEHMECHIETKDFLCDRCGKSFKCRSHVQQHKRERCTAIERERKFKCDICDARFYKPNRKREHMEAVHSDIRKFTCEICGAMFKTLSVLQRHIKRMHSEDTDRPTFKCDICDSTFKENGLLRRHKKVHTKQFNHSCEYCGKQFYERWNLKAHMRQHTGDKPYKCEKCGMGFAHNVSRKAHMAKCD